MAITHFRYKILVLDEDDEIMDLSPFFQGGDVTDELDSPSAARFEFLDKEGLIENSLNYSKSIPIVFSVSTNSGVSYERMFLGEVEDIDISISPSGEKTTNFNAFGSPMLRYSYLSPNQVAIGRCDIGALFTGTSQIYFTNGDDSWTCSWNSDSRGNYPNGLLFDTGYSYAGTADLYPGISDVPIKIGMSSANRLDYIKQLLNPYGLHFFIEDHYLQAGQSPKFSVKSNPYVSSWDTASWISLEFGVNINSYNRRINLGQMADKILVISDESNDAFFIYGDGRREAAIGASDVVNGATMRDIAEAQYNIYNTIPETVDVVALPITNLPPHSTSIPSYYLIGQKIKIIETSGITRSANVKKLVQNFTIDRWVTELSLENAKPTAAKLFSEIRDKLRKDQEDTQRGNAYVRADTATTSDYSDNNSSPFYRPCAVVLGTGSPYETYKLLTDPLTGYSLYKYNREFVDKPIAIKECRSVYTNETSTNGDSITTSAFATFPASEAIGLITEMGVIGNRNSGSLYKNIATFSVERANYATQTFPYYTIETGLPAAWVVRLDSIRPHSIYQSCSAYCWRASEFDTIKYISTLPDVVDATHSSWSSAPSLPDLKKLSMDNPTEFNLSDAITLSSDDMNRMQVLLGLNLPFEPKSTARGKTHALKFNPLLACYHSESGAETRVDYVFRFWNFTTNAWSTPVAHAHDDSDWDDIGSEGIDDLGYSPDDYISDDGRAFLLLEVNGSTLEMGSKNKMYFQYAGATLHYLSRENDVWFESGTQLNRVVERADYNPQYGTFNLTFKPWKVEGLWVDATEDPRLMNPPVPSGTNYIDRLKAQDYDFGPAGNRTFETFYDIYVPATMEHGPAIDTRYNMHRTPAAGWARVVRSIFGEEDYKKVVERGYAYFSYSTADVMKNPSREYKNTGEVYVREDYNGSASDLILDMRTRPDCAQFIVEYSSCGPKDWDDQDDCILMGIAIINTESAIRYGINKNQNINLNVQVDVAGTYFTSSMDSFSTESGAGTVDPVGDVGDFSFTRSGVVII